VLAVATREALWLIARGHTALPPAIEQFCGSAESLVHVALGGTLSSRNPAAHLIRGYLHGAGIEAGYSYFAPNLAGGYTLFFEIHLPDGRIDYDSFRGDNRESELRLATLLDHLGKARSAAVRDAIIELLARRVWHHYPDALRVKAVLAATNLPTPAEFKEGQRETYEFFYAREFSRSPLSE
jgi:hypothetical protein